MNIETLLERCDIGDCWEFTGARTSQGYGNVRCEGRNRVAHRVVYEHLVGDVPEGLQLDHLCRNRACVNPDHLEPVTASENLRRGRAGHHKNREGQRLEVCRSGRHDMSIHRRHNRCWPCTLEGQRKRWLKRMDARFH